MGEKRTMKKTNHTEKQKEKELMWDNKEVKKISEKGKTNVNTQQLWIISKAIVTFLQDFRDWQTAYYEQHPSLFPQRFLQPSNVAVTSCLKSNSPGLGCPQHKAQSCLISPRSAASANPVYTFICFFSKQNPSWVTSPGMKIEVKKASEFVSPDYSLNKKLRNNFLFLQSRVFKALVDSSLDHPTHQNLGQWNGMEVREFQRMKHSVVKNYGKSLRPG